MRVSNMLANTLREVPAEAEIVSHKLLLRAGFIKKVASGVYSYLPMGWRVMQKIMDIIRDEMNKAGGLELGLPSIHPAELWLETGRWNVYGDELFRLKDRHQRDFCLGPTHEEVLTDIVRKEVSSYKQLPLLLYQIQNKYRDERRPRFGLMRGREFIMKDLYSFDKDVEGMRVSYKKMYDAYVNIFRRCGLEFRAVEADSGAIGGKTSHEFMVLAQNGEAEIVYCPNCEYAANVEKAEAHPEVLPGEELKAIEKVHTPGAKTMDKLAEHLDVPKSKTIKTMLYKADEELVCVLVRGDRSVNEIKVKNLLDCVNLEIASEAVIQEEIGIPMGYVGPVDMPQKVKIIADAEINYLSNIVVGANEKDYHLINVNPGRDFRIDIEADVRIVEEGEKCPCSTGSLKKARGIEVGQVFQLGTKYSEALKAVYADEKGNNNYIVMGCYGIGVGRTMAAAIEQNHDQDGIIWPMTIAPFHAAVIPVSSRDEQQVQVAEGIYQDLKNSGVEVIMDDRDERAGVKFKDADLIGYPLQIIIGKKTITEGTVDLVIRKNKEAQQSVRVENVVEAINNLIKADIRSL
ncbi:proline--tRNA ligase [Desulfitibacter alkalitolerans]|uniref:proline--tRNA ligase n=1 Tax=Desulfitibacter alkalitolerans TaxID=264641 RepID=UPI000482B67C|nr:proline--tRNA ligase [Desulfitibacter alkalitolerans]